MVLKQEMGIRTIIQFGLKLEVFQLDLAALARHVWHALKLQGISVPCSIVESLLSHRIGC